MSPTKFTASVKSFRGWWVRISCYSCDLSRITAVSMEVALLTWHSVEISGTIAVAAPKFRCLENSHPAAQMASIAEIQSMDDAGGKCRRARSSLFNCRQTEDEKVEMEVGTRDLLRQVLATSELK